MPAGDARNLSRDLPLALRRRRDELRLTQREVEQRSGLPPKSVSKLETGSARITAEHLDALLPALEIPDLGFLGELVARVELSRPRRAVRGGPGAGLREGLAALSLPPGSSAVDHRMLEHCGRKILLTIHYRSLAAPEDETVTPAVE